MKKCPSRQFGQRRREGSERQQPILLPVSTYNLRVEKKVRIFSSFEEADDADARDYMAMSPEQRIQIVIELRDRLHPDAAKQGLARVCRVIKREQS